MSSKMARNGFIHLTKKPSSHFLGLLKVTRKHTAKSYAAIRIMSINKVNIIFISIILAAVGIVSVFVIKQSYAEQQKSQAVAQSTATLRKLELEIPSMFCAGCTASVENYLSVVPGVQAVTARLTPTKSATVFYDPAAVSQETILANEIFNAYNDPQVVSDEFFVN
jgi:copper chaperone CopZ